MKTDLGKKAFENISLVKDNIKELAFQQLKSSISVFDEDLSNDLEAITYNGKQAKTKLTNISELEPSAIIGLSEWLS